MKINSRKKGISGIEVLVVTAILGILLAVIVPEFQKSRETQVLNASVGDILSALSRARTQTLGSVDSSSYGVRFENDKVIIFKGTSYSAGDPGNEEIALVPPSGISDVTLAGVSGPSGSLYFRRLSGSPNKGGTVTVSTPSYSKVITITATGSASAD